MEKSTREDLAHMVLNHLTDKQVEFLYEFLSSIKRESWVSKGLLMKLAYTREENNKLDSALPHEYVKRIQEIHPNFKTMFHCYNYNTMSLGEMSNVAEDFVMKMAHLFNEDE